MGLKSVTTEQGVSVTPHSSFILDWAMHIIKISNYPETCHSTSAHPCMINMNRTGVAPVPLADSRSRSLSFSLPCPQG